MLFLGRVIGVFAASYSGSPLLTNQDFIIRDKGFFRLLLSNLMTFVEGWCFIRWDTLTPRIPQKISLPQITSWTSKKNLKEICSKNCWWNQNTTTGGMGWQKSHNFPKHSPNSPGTLCQLLGWWLWSCVHPVFTGPDLGLQQMNLMDRREKFDMKMFL